MNTNQSAPLYESTELKADKEKDINTKIKNYKHNNDTGTDADIQVQEITAISWTGGKDCNLALLYAIRNPALNVKYLITFRPEGKKFKAHPLPFIEAQADALGLKLLYVVIPANTTDYMMAYVEGMQEVHDQYGIQVICTGDMDLVGTMERNWIERCCEKVNVRQRVHVCDAVTSTDVGTTVGTNADTTGSATGTPTPTPHNMRAYLPLWQKDRSECLNELLDEGFETIYTCVKSPFFDGSWINRRLDHSALQDMRDIIHRNEHQHQHVDAANQKQKPLDLCGERGEYHTMCLNGPIYKKKVCIGVNDVPIREDIVNGTHWKGNIHNADSIWTISLRDDVED